MMYLNKKLNKTNFALYLTGLIEGDGSIIVPKNLRSKKGKLNYPSIQICFHVKDLPLVFFIQKRLGFGSILKKKGKKAYIFIVNDSFGILFLISLLNGNMRTPKIKSLWNLIDWLNLKNKNLNIEKYDINKDNFNKDAWFSGFIDADGHFSVRCSLKKLNNNQDSKKKKTSYKKIECKFELVQRCIDHNNLDNFEFLNNLSKFLNLDLKIIKKNTKNPQYRIRTLNLKSNLILVNYLNNYPLFSSKFLDYNDWLIVLNFFKLKYQKKEDFIEKILLIKSNMNQKRVIFNWDHLQNFYTLNGKI